MWRWHMSSAAAAGVVISHTSQFLYWLREIPRLEIA